MLARVIFLFLMVAPNQGVRMVKRRGDKASSKVTESGGAEQSANSSWDFPPVDFPPAPGWPPAPPVDFPPVDFPGWPPAPGVPPHDDSCEKCCTYFGVKCKKGLTIFVFDKSGSMKVKFKNTTRWDAVIDETKKALKSMPSNKQFFIISYGLKAEAAFKSAKAATPANVQAALKWVQREKGRLESVKGPGTNAHDALALALKAARQSSMAEIMFMSDGMPNINGDAKKVLDMVKQRNTKKVTINAISIGGPKGFMQQLATDNGGIFREP